MLLGLDGAGKTTLLYWLTGKAPPSQPTMGFNVERFRHASVAFTGWDASARPRIRAMWRDLYEDMDGIVFVIDAGDCEGLLEARALLADEVLTSDYLRRWEVPLLILVNGQDKPGAVSLGHVREILGLAEEAEDGGAALTRTTATMKKTTTITTSGAVGVFGCVATTGDGVRAGFDWLAMALLTRTKTRPQRPSEAATATRTEEGSL